MADLSTVTAAILVGGLGTRLRPVVSDRPKVLAAIHGRPFLTYLLDQLEQAGCRRVVLCTGYMASMVRDVIGDKYRSLSIDYSPEDVPLGTAGALRLALPKLASDPVLVLNGDSFCEADLREFARFHDEKAAAAALVVTRVPDVSRFGAVQLSADDRVVRFDEKGNAAGEGWINAGIYLLGRALLESIPADRAVSIEKEIFPAWLERGVGAFRQTGRFIDIGTEASYRAAESFFKP